VTSLLTSAIRLSRLKPVRKDQNKTLYGEETSKGVALEISEDNSRIQVAFYHLVPDRVVIDFHGLGMM